MTKNKPRALLLSAYHAQSHQVWAERVQQLFDDWHWHCLSLAPRHFNWRIRSNGLHWAYAEQAVLAENWDLLLATSMVDLASLRSLCPALCDVPTLVYFHENQFAYPANDKQSTPANIEPLLVPIYSALSADCIAFNSEYNRTSFMAGVSSLSKKLPEPLPAGALEKLRAAEVIPVPVNWPATKNSPALVLRDSSTDVLEVVWNHRWEYDKNPALLLEVTREILAQQLPVRLHIVGQQFRQQPAEFHDINTLLEQWCKQNPHSRGAWGYLPDTEYRALLNNADVALSTADHDFQGLAVQEACLAGCSPLAPAALVYPEYLDSTFLYPIEKEISRAAATITQRLSQLLKQKQTGIPLPVPELAHYSGDAVREKYARVFAELGVS